MNVRFYQFHLLLHILLWATWEPKFLCNANEERDARVLILGAGLSGLSAAKTLHENGITDFIILEGDSSIGGRLKSIDFEGTTINIGAQWVHFSTSENNPIWELKTKYGIQGQLTDYDNLIIRDEEGMDVTDTADPLWEGYDEAEEIATDHFLEDIENGVTPDLSAEAALKYGGWSPVSPLENSVEYFMFDFEYAEPSDCTSFQATTNYPEESDFYITDSRGFAVMAEEFSKEFLDESDDRLKLNTLVEKIYWSENLEDGVMVVTEGGQNYTADFVLCTFSIGVLENRIHQLFYPELPDWKSEEIFQFHANFYTSMFIKFQEKFWDDEEWIMFAPKKRGNFPAWGNLHGVFPDNSDNFLYVCAVNEESRRIESQSDDETLQEILEVLGKMYPSATIPPASQVRIYVTKWGQDPLQYGSFSNWPVDVSEKDFEKIQAPVGNLHFAGEHTHERYNGYLQGAILSGVDRGNDILACINDECNPYEPPVVRFGCTYTAADNYDSSATEDDGSCTFKNVNSATNSPPNLTNFVFCIALFLLF